MWSPIASSSTEDPRVVHSHLSATEGPDVRTLTSTPVMASAPGSLAEASNKIKTASADPPDPSRSDPDPGTTTAPRISKGSAGPVSSTHRFPSPSPSPPTGCWASHCSL